MATEKYFDGSQWVAVSGLTVYVEGGNSMFEACKVFSSYSAETLNLRMGFYTVKKV